MTDKELIKQLNKFQSVKLDETWKESNREVLLSQISNNSQEYKETIWIKIVNFSQNFAHAIAQPAVSITVLVFVLLSGAVFTNAFSGTQPNESLYIARVISEKAKINMTLDREIRDRKAIRFATSHAKDISNILSSPEFNREDQAEVEKLQESFKKEISVARARLNSLNLEPDVVEDIVDEDVVISIADAGKDNDGLEVYAPEEAITPEIEVEIIPVEEIATSTPSAHDILDQAQELFDQEDYEGAHQKLTEVDSTLE